MLNRQSLFYRASNKMSLTALRLLAVLHVLSASARLAIDILLDALILPAFPRLEEGVVLDA
jgi:hypothetical protein